MLLEASARTDPGPVRERNDDAFFIDQDAGLFIVADGMGGHRSGDVAARLAVDTVREVLLGQVDPDETRLDRASPDAEESMRERLRYATNQASHRIRKAALAEERLAGMGTTLAILLIEDDVAHLGHVGDSRVYLFRDGRLLPLTRDHTVVQQEIDAGRLTPELARKAAHKNILTQSVGYHGAVEPDTSTRPVLPGDLFLLCTDGLTDPLSDEQITALCASSSAEDVPDRLVEAAIAGNGQDNVTVLAIRVLG